MPTQTINIVDTSTSLTLEELKELKQLANLSKSSKIFVGVLIGIVTLIGFPSVLSFVSKHIS